MNYRIHGMFASICAPLLYNDFLVSARFGFSLSTDVVSVITIIAIAYSFFNLKHAEVPGRANPKHMIARMVVILAMKVKSLKQYIPAIVSLCFPPNVAPAITSGINFIAATCSPIILSKVTRNTI